MVKILIVVILSLMSLKSFALNNFNNYIIKLIASKEGIPPSILYSVCFVESKHDSTKIHVDDNGSNSIGFCQIKLETAHLMGYKGNEQGLLNKQVNLIFSAKYLKYQLNRYHGDIRKAVLAYNSGTYKLNYKNSTSNYKLTTKKQGVATNEPYYIKVKTIIKSLYCEINRNKTKDFVISTDKKI